MAGYSARCVLCRKSQDMDVSLISAMILLAGFAVCVTALLTWIARQVAPRLGFVDRPDGRRKTHRQATPLLGGAAVFLGLLSTMAVFCLVTSSPIHGYFLETNSFATEILAIPSSSAHFISWCLATAAIYCAIGIYDDRWPLRPRTKFCLQVLACLPFATWGRTIPGISAWGIELQFGSFGPIVTVFWLVACVNAFNLIDGMDGQATCLGGIACAAFAGLALLRGDVSTAIFA